MCVCVFVCVHYPAAHLRMRYIICRLIARLTVTDRAWLLSNIIFFVADKLSSLDLTTVGAYCSALYTLAKQLPASFIRPRASEVSLLWQAESQ